MKTKEANRKKSIIKHSIAICVVIGFPFFIGPTENMTLDIIGFYLIPSLLILMLFYSNYSFLIGKYLFTKRYAAFTLSNVGLFALGIFILSSDTFIGLKKEYQRQERQRIIKTLELEKDNEEAREAYEFMKKHWETPQKQKNKEMRRMPRRKHFRHFDKRFVTSFLLFGFIVVLISIGLRSSQRALAEVTRRKHIENEYLKSQNAFLSYQIQPHFFFNTLNSIHALIDISTDQAKATLIDLSRLMRYVLNVSEQEEVLLNKEIDFLKNYCDLMKLRISDDFDFKFDFPETFNQNKIAPLLLIVLVENAFKHGVSGLSTDFIHMSCTEHKNEFVFTVHNSRYDNQVQTSADSSIGIENLKTRLQLLYPNRHSLQVSENKTNYKSILTISL